MIREGRSHGLPGDCAVRDLMSIKYSVKRVLIRPFCGAYLPSLSMTSFMSCLIISRGTISEQEVTVNYLVVRIVCWSPKGVDSCWCWLNIYNMCFNLIDNYENSAFFMFQLEGLNRPLEWRRQLRCHRHGILFNQSFLLARFQTSFKKRSLRKLGVGNFSGIDLSREKHAVLLCLTVSVLSSIEINIYESLREAIWKGQIIYMDGPLNLYGFVRAVAKAYFVSLAWGFSSE